LFDRARPEVAPRPVFEGWM